MATKHLISQLFHKFTCFCFRFDNYPPNCHQPGISLPLALHWLFRDNSTSICDSFWENAPKHADNIFPDLPIKA